MKNKINYNNNFYNIYQIFRCLNFSQKIKFIIAFFNINLSLKNYKYYEIRSKEQWVDYFNAIDEQNYIKKLSEKLKNKKIIIYGAGIISEVLFANYDLSNFNIIGISDKRFERTNEKELYGLPAIRPDKLNDTEFEVILFALKLHKKAAQSLDISGVHQKTYSLIKKNNKYAVRL